MAVSGDDIARAAQGFAGKPYVWGGAGPSGWDCSSFVSYVLCTDLKLPIPGYAGGAYTPASGHGPVVSSYLGWTGASTQKSPVAGDLVCWGPNEHIGIMTSSTEMISALNPSLGTRQTTIAGGSPGGTPTYRRLNDVTPGSAGGTSGSSASSTDPNGLSAADQQQLVAAGCLPGAALIYLITIRSTAWISKHHRPQRFARWSSSAFSRR